MNLQAIVLQLLTLVINNADLQDKLAAPIGKTLASVLPDVTEDAVANFLAKVAADLKAANP